MQNRVSMICSTMRALCVLTITALAMLCAVQGICRTTWDYGDYRWDILTTEDGLLNGLPWAVFCSLDGSVWISYVSDGVTQWKDEKLVGWSNAGANDVPTDVTDFCEDRDGTLWCITRSDGCWYLRDGAWFKEDEFAYLWPPFGAVPALPREGDTIQMGIDGRLWAAFGAGIMWFDPETRQSEVVWETPRRWDWDFYYCPEKMLVSSQHGIWFESGDDVLQIGYNGRLLSTNLGFESEGYREAFGFFAEDPSGQVWFSGTIMKSVFEYVSGLFCLEEDGWGSFQPPGGVAGGDGPVFISFRGEMLVRGAVQGSAGNATGFWTWNGKEWSFYETPFEKPYYSRSVAIDLSGNLWVPGIGPFLSEGPGIAVCQRNLLVHGGLQITIATVVAGASLRSSYGQGDQMGLLLDLTADATLEGEARTVDLYVSLELPSGELLFYPMFGTEMAPFLAGIEIPADTHLEDYELFSLMLPDLPAGTYRWFAACTHAGSMEFASNIASCEWQFE